MRNIHDLDATHTLIIGLEIHKKVTALRRTAVMVSEAVLSLLLRMRGPQLDSAQLTPVLVLVLVCLHSFIYSANDLCQFVSLLSSAHFQSDPILMSML